MQNFSFDIKKTKAILIGVSDYDFLPKIEPAVNNITDMVNLLTDNSIIGLPVNNILQIINKRNDEINTEILEFLADENNIEVETLIFYYVGHGIRDLNSRELYLTGKNSKKNTIRTSAISYDEIKQQIENSQIQKRIVLIDACHSGLAAMDADNESYTESELDIKGSYILTSAAGNERAFFDTSNRNTFFTAELLNIMKQGLPVQQPFISLENVFNYLRNNLRQSTPKRKSNLNASDFYLFRNSKFDKLSILAKAGDDLFENGEYKKALAKFLEICVEKDSVEIRNKIEKCRENISIIKKNKELHQEMELWKTACSINTITSYQEYIKKTISEKFKHEAQLLIAKLEKELEDELWQKAKVGNSKELYEDYLRAYPNGIYKTEAIAEIEKTGERNIEKIYSKKYLLSAATIIVFIFLLLGFYSRNQYNKDFQKWKIAVGKNDSLSYMQYINGLPNGRFIGNAKQKVDSILEIRLADNNAWKIAKDSNTIASYNSYKIIFPFGKNIDSANFQIQILEFYNEGLKFYLKGNWEEAIKNFLKSFKINTKDDRTLFYIGYSYLQTKDTTQALEYFGKSISISNNVYSLRIRGQIYYIRNQYSEAIEDFDKLTNVGNWEEEFKAHSGTDHISFTYFQRGFCKHKLGDKRGACEDLKKAADLGNKYGIKCYDLWCN